MRRTAACIEWALVAATLSGAVGFVILSCDQEATVQSQGLITEASAVAKALEENMAVRAPFEARASVDGSGAVLLEVWRAGAKESTLVTTTLSRQMSVRAFGVACRDAWAQLAIGAALRTPAQASVP